MRLVRDMAMVAVGIGATIMYQKYSKTMMIGMEKAMNKMAECASNKLDDMI